MTLNFSRLHHQRPGYGYAGVPDPWLHVPEPRDDGIYHLDLETGAQRLVIPTALLAETRRKPTMDGAVHRFNHLQFSPDGRRFIFLHRWRPQEGNVRGHLTRLCTASPDGSQIALLADEDLVSHFDWRDPQHVLAWARHGGVDAFWLLPDPSGPANGPAEAQIVGREAMPRDGHCSYSPDGARRWIANDTYPDAEQRRTLYVFDTADGAPHRPGALLLPAGADAGLPGRPAPALEPGRAPDLLRLGARGLAPALRRGRPGLKTHPPPPAPGLLSWCGPWYRS